MRRLPMGACNTWQWTVVRGKAGDRHCSYLAGQLSVLSLQDVHAVEALFGRLLRPHLLILGGEENRVSVRYALLCCRRDTWQG